MEKEMTDLLMELNRQRDCNDLMRDKVSHLEMSLEHSKVLSILITNTQLFKHFHLRPLIFLFNELMSFYL